MGGGEEWEKKTPGVAGEEGEVQRSGKDIKAKFDHVRTRHGTET